MEGEFKDSSASQSDLLQIKQEYRRVLSAMEELEDGEREILTLVISGDLSYKEIASIIGTSEGNIKVRVHRARVKLRNKLKMGD